MVFRLKKSFYLALGWDVPDKFEINEKVKKTRFRYTFPIYKWPVLGLLPS